MLQIKDNFLPPGHKALGLDTERVNGIDRSESVYRKESHSEEAVVKGVLLSVNKPILIHAVLFMFGSHSVRLQRRRYVINAVH